jgi:hypothetical protein
MPRRVTAAAENSGLISSGCSWVTAAVRKGYASPAAAASRGLGDRFDRSGPCQNHPALIGLLGNWLRCVGNWLWLLLCRGSRRRAFLKRPDRPLHVANH